MNEKNTESGSGRLALTDAYSTGMLSKDRPTELARLNAIERWSDPVAWNILERIPLRPEWHCLEAGAGAGSMAYWLAAQCPEGHVVAADIDPRHLDARRASNLEVVTTDVVRHDFPKSSFDLIHARLLLSHLSQRDEILRRMFEWLKPGGSMLIEDFYILPSDDQPDVMRWVFDALARSLSAQGADVHWARGIPNRMAAIGLTDLTVTMTPLSIGMDPASNAVWSLGLDQVGAFWVEKGFLTAAQLAAHRAASGADAIAIPWMMVSVSGKRM